MMLVKWIRYCVIVVGCLVVLSGCEGCQTRTCYGPSLSGGKRFAQNMMVFIADEYCTYDQSSLLGDPKPNDDYSRIYLIRLDSTEVFDVTKELRAWWGLQGVVGNSSDRSWGMNAIFLENIAIAIQKLDGLQRQTWVFDPYGTPKMKKLGEPWSVPNEEYDWIEITPYGKDSVLINFSPNDLAMMDSAKSYYKIQSVKTGVIKDFKTPDGKFHLNDVIQMGDTLLTLLRVDSSYGYMYRYLGNKKDSVYLPLDSMLDKNDFYDSFQFLRFSTSAENSGRFSVGHTYYKGGGVLISEMKIALWGDIYGSIPYEESILREKHGDSLYVTYRGKTIVYPHWKDWRK